MSNHLTVKHTPLYVDRDLSIIIPAYNEEQRITPTLESLSTFLAAHPYRYELIVVDDGSKDGTVALCRALAERLPHLRVIATSPNRGKGHAVRVGMLAARGAVRVMCDADGSMPASELPKLLAPIASGRATIAIGSRYVAGAAQHTQPLWRRAWSRLCNQIIQAALVPGVRDTQCGFKAFTAGAAHDLFTRATIDGWAFDLEVLAVAKRMGHEVAEVGVQWTDDRRSRVNPLKDLWKVVREAVTIKRNLRRNAYGLLGAAA
ncbi:MAG: glycosyltransferase family 2 protein [Kofleriaceae bacterium]|nr:glycosyltransferase family 2 protein [Kofleriaceae bacterium]MCL4223814.1 glycosyltransferase family 2 protein [Myxococcales bacterium]